ncbi:MAG TPA: SRPBCC family protein [Candidatus Limnocylindrales bacterium]|nr:SRPBCC family protein [Candidatus Limnocylindrales bacterium]
MDTATQRQLLQRAFRLLDADATDMAEAPYVNAVATYVDAEAARRERESLFAREPLLVAFSSELAAPGSYLERSEGPVPILLTRSQAGAVSAFVNVCRHRGARVVEGAGAASRFTCPYHGWTYDGGGRLCAMPYGEGFRGIDRATLSLRALPVQERYGMIFVRSGGDERFDLDAQLGGAQRELAAFDLAAHVPFARSSVPVAMNWKLAVDTFLEAYHLPALHRQSLSPMILSVPSLWDAFGRGGRMVALRRSFLELRGLPEEQWRLIPHATILYQLFPNTVLIYQGDHAELVQAWPGATPDTCTVTFALLTPGPAGDEKTRRYFQSNFDLLVRTVCDEDFATGEKAQRAFCAGALESVIYGRNEPALAHFHRMVHSVLRDHAA